MEEKKDEKIQSWWQPGLVLFAKTSGWIGVPIIVALFVGRWLDRKYGTDPWLFLSTIGVAFLISSFGIMMESIKVMKNIDKEGEGKKPQRNKDTISRDKRNKKKEE